MDVLAFFSMTIHSTCLLYQNNFFRNFRRYECEGRSAGALQGEHSTSENKTFPSIQIEGYVVRRTLFLCSSIQTSDHTKTSTAGECFPLALVRP